MDLYTKHWSVYSDNSLYAFKSYHYIIHNNIYLYYVSVLNVFLRVEVFAFTSIIQDVYYKSNTIIQHGLIQKNDIKEGSKNHNSVLTKLVFFKQGNKF